MGVACLGCRTRLPHIHPSLAALIPSDTVLLAGAQVEPLRKHLPGSVPLLQERNVSELLLVSNGVDTAILARGQFAGQQPEGVSFLDASTAVAGSPAAVRAILAARDRGDKVPAGLREGLRAIPAEHQVWIVAAGGLGALDSVLPRSGNASNLRRLLSFLESLTASADVRELIRGSAVATCRTLEDARSFADALRGFSLLAGYQDAVKVSTQGREVRVEFSLR